MDLNKLKMALKNKGLTQNNEISKYKGEDPCPATPGQVALCFSEMMDPLDNGYLIPGLCNIKGPLNVKAFEFAWNSTLKRQEVLRANFVLNSKAMLWELIIRDFEEEELIFKDCSSLKDPSKAIREEIEKELSLKRDLGKDPLAKIKLYQKGAEEFVLATFIHHIITDGISYRIFIDDLMFFYDCHLKRDLSKENPRSLPIQFRDFCYYQNNFLKKGPIKERSEKFWKDTLSDLRKTKGLPTDFSRDSGNSSKGAHQNLEIPRGTYLALQKLASETSTTIFTVLLNSVYFLLNKLQKESDLIIGVPMGGRQKKELENLIGYFVQVLPVRTNLNSNFNFKEHLKEVSTSFNQVLDHQELPFASIVDLVNPPREKGVNPFFQVEVTHHNMKDIPSFFGYGLGKCIDQGEFIGDLKFSPYPLDNKSSKFDLTFLFWEGKGDLGLSLEYNSDLFKEETIRNWLGKLEGLLIDISKKPEEIFPLEEKKERPLNLKPSFSFNKGLKI